MSANQITRIGIALSVAMLGGIAQGQQEVGVPQGVRDPAQQEIRQQQVVQQGEMVQTQRDVRLQRGVRNPAHQEYRLQQGDRTLTISGSGSSDRDFDANVASVELGLGWFIVDNVALAVRQGVGFADTGRNSDWNGSSRLGLEFFLDMGILKPFVGAGIGYIYGDSVRSQFIAGPTVGVLYFLNPTTFVNLGVEYQFLFKNSREARDVYDDGRFVYALGMGVKW